MTHTLPRCPMSDLPRIHCAHCDSFTMTEAERAHLAHTRPTWDEPTPIPTPQPLPRRAGAQIATLTHASRPYQPPADTPPATTGQPCPLCDQPTGDAYLCPTCTQQTARDLGDIPALVEDLTAHATGQARFAGTGDGHGLPYAEHAARLLHDIHNHLATSIRTLTEQRGQPTPTITTTEGMSRWLLTHHAAIPLDPAGPDIAHGLRRWHHASLHAIDTPPERRYIGLCQNPTATGPCGTPMHAPEGAEVYHCPRCGYGYDVAVCLEAITARVRDVTATVTELVVLARHSDYRGVTENLIKGMIRRGRLQRVGRRRPHRYRAGDLFAALDERKAG